jgi:hypothetical protein
MIPILSVVCRGEDLQKGLVPGLSGDMVVYPGAVNPRSAVNQGFERLTYQLDVAYPAEGVIGSISRDLARRGWRPLRNNWHNRDETSEYVRGWVQSTVVSKPGGKERYLCRWWAQWRNAEGEIVDYALGYMSATEEFTNRSQLHVSATRMSISVAQRLTPAYAKGQQVLELPVGTPPNSATATDNYPHALQVRRDGEQPCATGAISLIDGKWYQSSVYPAQLAAAPTWRPDLEPQPPLSPGQAVVLARRKISQLFPKIKDWQATQVTLGWAFLPEHWYYTIIFNRIRTEPGPGERIPTFPILVLMNGKVIQPTVRPEPSAPGASPPPAP